MANKPKVGLSYYNIEVDIFSDIKVRKLIKYQSAEAVSVYLYLLCTIYRDGYYMRWDEELPFVISEATGSKEGYISEVIKCCFKVGLFDNNLFENEGILTSHGIQKRYAFICQLLKRKFSVREFSLISSEELRNSSVRIPKNSEELDNNTGEKTQKKRKEKKIKESIGAPPDFFDKNFDERKQIFKQILKPFVAEFGKPLMREFFDYWTQESLPGSMYFEVQNDFYPKIRLENWRRVGAKTATQQNEQSDDFKKLKKMFNGSQNQ